MILSAIMAMSKNRVIGKDNALPWHLPSNLKRFKAITLHGNVLMGRKTYESLNRVDGLPSRVNYVFSRQKKLDVGQCVLCSGLDDFLSGWSFINEAFLIGGHNIYQQYLINCSMLYLTTVDIEIDGTRLPENVFDGMVKLCEEKVTDDNLPYTFSVWRRM